MEKSSGNGRKGYREGMDDGSDDVLQEGFDLGYVEAFKTSFAIGIYKSMAQALPKTVEISKEIEEILRTSDTGACVLCKNTVSVSSRRKTEEKTLEQILKEQRQHSAHIIKMLYDYFVPLLKEHNVTLDPMKIEELPHPDRDL
ncbi:uncharacterized protein LOC122498475 isoform X2 [Leptopilina heterotoma]|uniref:uncharacterized protein LOC122498475 isoform X2 n=1 Tax=Leptopilina heterotoma TaxID=63436 RepID=UPI001CA8D44A|nr:uncharacterized protein LOC122498475 isoform X2 [Leptopilina heterotoma]